MRKEYFYHRNSSVILWLVAALVGACAVWAAFQGALLIGGICLFMAAMGIWAARRMGQKKPFLIVDQTGIESPDMKIKIAWSNVESVFIFVPPRTADNNAALAFKVRDESACGPGAYKPNFLKALMDKAGAPRIYIEIPTLDAKIDAILADIEKIVPAKVGPTVFAEPRREHFNH